MIAAMDVRDDNDMQDMATDYAQARGRSGAAVDTVFLNRGSDRRARIIAWGMAPPPACPRIRFELVRLGDTGWRIVDPTEPMRSWSVLAWLAEPAIGQAA